jgi:hypothetical protein
MDRANIEREPVKELPVSPQGTCDSGPFPVNPEISSRDGWQLVAQSRRTNTLANTTFEAATVAAEQSQPALVASISDSMPQQQLTPTPNPAPTPGPSFPDNLWQVTYHQDRDQIGQPVVVQANNINFDSRNGWPGQYGIPTNNFRAVFSGTFLFNETRSYLFTLNLRGSGRVYIDDRQVIDAYQIGRKSPGRYRLPVSAGMHTIRVEYYNDYGPASIYFDWTPDSNRHDYWLGRYYNNLIMDGTPAMIRQDDNLTFNWDASPGGDVGVDNFSVQWVRVMNVPRNGCVCRMLADDKVRLYVDGVLVPELSNWDAANPWNKTVRLNGGRRFLEIHFVEQGGAAVIQFTCDPVTPAY